MRLLGDLLPNDGFHLRPGLIAGPQSPKCPFHFALLGLAIHRLHPAAQNGFGIAVHDLRNGQQALAVIDPAMGAAHPRVNVNPCAPVRLVPVVLGLYQCGLRPTVVAHREVGNSAAAEERQLNAPGGPGAVPVDVLEAGVWGLVPGGCNPFAQGQKSRTVERTEQTTMFDADFQAFLSADQPKCCSVKVCTPVRPFLVAVETGMGVFGNCSTRDFTQKFEEKNINAGNQIRQVFRTRRI